MSRRRKEIPIYTLPPGAGGGMMIMRQIVDGSSGSQVKRPHRDSGYTFILQEKGITHIEIDFQMYRLEAPAVIFIRPGQVHRVIGFEAAEISTWMITAENLRPAYMQALNDLASQNAVSLPVDSLAQLSLVAGLCRDIFEAGKPQPLILQDACNMLVGMVLSHFAAEAHAKLAFTRFESVSKAFQKVLESNFTTVKSPAAYADRLHISVSYLNECVHSATGRSVTESIRERVVLEAKRLLYHSNRSVKEIAAELGYDDFSYFTRVFVRVTGLTPIAFRDKNRDAS